MKTLIAGIALALLTVSAIVVAPSPSAAQIVPPIKLTPRPKKTAVPKAPKKAPVGTPAPTAVPRRPVAQVELRSDRMGYDWWGRPAAMDSADGACSQLDDSRRTLRLEASFQIINRSKTQLTPKDYWVQFYKTDGKEAVTCYWAYNTGTGAPNIDPGQTVNITFMAFVEPSERLGYAQVLTRPFGRGNRINVPGNLSIPNQ
jgi:hypothetical protein